MCTAAGRRPPPREDPGGSPSTPPDPQPSHRPPPSECLPVCPLGAQAQTPDGQEEAWQVGWKSRKTISGTMMDYPERP
eukprot:5272436-Alexandrium_andersonii.AAC.1